MLTDTSSSDVPIIVSNHGIYDNLCEFWYGSAKYRTLIGVLLFNQNLGKPNFNTWSEEEREKSIRQFMSRYTIPYKFSITKDDGEFRNLSLIHPFAQIQLSIFYEYYDQLMCEFAGKSPFSIRKPVGTTSGRYADHELARKSKSTDSVWSDVTDINRFDQHPKKYFEYSGYSLLYQFFQSKEHRELERRFKYRLALDISKCFDSIYTHSICWTMTSKKTAKRNRGSRGFFNSFDKIMRQLNHDETSGICVGPEVSRIFAEIILAKVDSTLQSNLAKKKWHRGVDYECRRYVDNYYFFGNSERLLDSIRDELVVILQTYRLYLNNEKSQLLSRPFYTNRSMVINLTSNAINRLRNRVFIDPISAEPSSHETLIRDFLGEVQTACYLSKLDYDSVASYVISSMQRSVSEVINSYDTVLFDDANATLMERHRNFFTLALDICFWFLAVHPTVPSSLTLARVIVQIGVHLRHWDGDGLETVSELVATLTLELAKSSQFHSFKMRQGSVPIEFFNVLLGVSEIGKFVETPRSSLITTNILRSVMNDFKAESYFSIIVALYILRDRAEFTALKQKIFDKGCQRLTSSDEFCIDSELVHLLLDLLACPFIDITLRRDLVCNIWTRLRNEGKEVGSISSEEAYLLVAEISKQHWFVRWSGIELYDLIEEKLFDSVY